MSDLITYASGHLPEVIAAGAGGLAALAIGAAGIRRLVKSAGRRSIAAVSAAAGAVLCTALTTNTSWRFFGTNLHVTNIPERTLMFAVLEMGLFACTMAARENLNNPEKGAPGLPGVAVWLLAGFAAIPAYSVGGDVIAGTVRTVLGPLMAVFLVHLALGMELRHRTPGAESKSAMATIGRALQQRLFARLGLGAADLTAQQISQNRAVAKAAVLSDRLSAMSDRRREGWYGQRITGRLRRQLRRAGVADDPARAEMLLAHLAVTRHALALSTLELPSPWTTPAVVVDVPQQQPEPEEETEQPPQQPPAEDPSDVDVLQRAEPPAWSSMTTQEAVERADAILPGPARGHDELAEILKKLGIETTGNYVRTARRRARKRIETTDAGELEQPNDGDVIPLQRNHAHAA